jgi:putative redox protein
MQMHLDWQGEMSFRAFPPSGAELLMDSPTDPDAPRSGPSPIEAFVSSLAACSAMDVVSILAKMRQPVQSYRVEVEWERGPKGEWPRPVTQIKVRHVLRGDLDPSAVEKAVRLSDEKYCGVTASLRTPPKLETAWEIEP